MKTVGCDLFTVKAAPCSLAYGQMSRAVNEWVNKHFGGDLQGEPKCEIDSPKADEALASADRIVPRIKREALVSGGMRKEMA